MDLEKFFDRVNHDVLMSRVAKRITDKRVLKLIRAFLNAVIMQAGLVSPQMEGTPQGGPLSPLLSNVLLDELDRELEKRGLKHVHYADDSNIYVRSERAGKRVKESITHWLEKRLKLKVNERKSAVSPPCERKFLGYSISSGKGRAWILIAPESIRRAKSRLREITGRSKGRSLEQVIGKLRVYLTGWRNYYSLNELPSLTRNLLGWVRRRLRSLLWKQWKKGRSRYSELRVRGVGKDLAAQTVGSCHKQ
ncbi:reverse transcriptase domain-containing protein [Symbiopectobacterium sp. RP]|uniref:reverse transcriptase domain-containing protein n=1 Tax=Symbiopectobacterium sp. RP TaxID=3248553 RepID=UPI003D2CC2BE